MSVKENDVGSILPNDVLATLITSLCPHGHKHKNKSIQVNALVFGTPDAIRTHDTWRRRPMLYPTELQAHIVPLYNKLIYAKLKE